LIEGWLGHLSEGKLKKTKPICPIIFGHIGFVYIGTGLLIKTKPMFPILIGHIGFFYISTDKYW
jgi:hypothetical protein